METLLHAIDAALTADPLVEASFRIPQSEGRVLAALERGATLSRQHFEGNLVFVRATGPSSLLERYRRYQTDQKLKIKQYRPPNRGAEVVSPSRGLHRPGYGSQVVSLL